MSKSVWKIRPDGRTVRRRKVKIDGAFVAMLKSTMKTPAWKALSPGARSLYLLLKCHYNRDIGNAVYVSVRAGARELGTSKNTVAKWFRELVHYGFIVMVSPPHLGAHGTGIAAHWRLTEEHHLGASPTRDFLSWDGTVFCDQASPRIGIRRRAPKNRTLSQKLRHPVPILGT